MNTYAVVLNSCTFLITSLYDQEAMKIADQIETLCSKHLLADEPIEVLNLTQGTRFDGLFFQQNPTQTGFVPFSEISDNPDKIKKWDKQKVAFFQYPIFPITANNLIEIEKHLRIICPICKNPTNKGRYSKYLKK